MQSFGGLTQRDIHIIVDQFIGTTFGELHGFSYRTLHEFLTLGLEIPEDTYQDGRTKRVQLILALQNSDTFMQAKILRELLARFPPDESINDREKARKDVELILAKLGSTLPLEIPHTVSGSEIVQETLQSARTLLESFGPAHAIDRIHTALHGYLKEKCHEQGIVCKPNDPITRLYKLLRENHPLLAVPAGWPVEIDMVMKAQSAVLDQLNHARCSGPQTVAPKPANKGRFRLRFGANKGRPGLTITANEPILHANSLQTA